MKDSSLQGRGGSKGPDSAERLKPGGITVKTTDSRVFHISIPAGQAEIGMKWIDSELDKIRISRNQLLSVTIPAGVTSTGYAFYDRCDSVGC